MESIFQKLTDQATTDLEKLERALELEQYRNEKILLKMKAFDHDKVTKAFAKIGVEEIRERVTVSFAPSKDSSHEILNAAKLHIGFRVKSMTMKPILFAGYTKSGAGRNNDRLIAKAVKIQDQINYLTGYSCSVNEYGLEVKNANDPFNFSIDIYI